MPTGLSWGQSGRLGGWTAGSPSHAPARPRDEGLDHAAEQARGAADLHPSCRVPQLDQGPISRAFDVRYPPTRCWRWRVWKGARRRLAGAAMRSPRVAVVAAEEGESMTKKLAGGFVALGLVAVLSGEAVAQAAYPANGQSPQQ